MTHISSLNQLLDQLQAVPNRAQFALLAELILRPSACGSAAMFSKLFPQEHNKREKVVSAVLTLRKIWVH
jgi:hypothetical protein